MKGVIKSMHDDIHGGVAVTQRRLRLQTWWLGYCKDVEEHIRRCPKCTQIKTWVAMDTGPYGPCTYPRHRFIYLTSFFLGLAGSKRWDRKATSVRQILRTIFARNGVPKTIVMDNASQFCGESLVSCLRKIGCMTYKTPPYYPQSNGIAERMVQTVKMGLKVFSSFNQNIKAYIPNLLFCYRTVPHADRKQSPSPLIDRQIRALITMSFATEEKVQYKRHKKAEPERAEFILQKGPNTAVLEKKRAANISSCWSI